MSLTYKKDPHFKSFTGGAVTIVTRLLVIYFFISQCRDLLNRQATIQSSFYKRDLINDPTQFVLSQDDFDFGVFLKYEFKE